eukprot:TRINITY_DN148_c0_g1_i1.p1 TRINITY_DN148_c0_g1~~TRINITY_DN148_c0_g1_i1.p1  ORF type:complete len:493 (+),score=88.02 TRINITY_DN148_c0_g1_i1:78-1556(+)
MIMMFTLLTLSLSTTVVSNQPHILYMVVDDLGWTDVGFHGSNFPTPVLDKLVTESVEMSKYYVQPSCSPTRSSLMTGRYPFNMGMQHLTTIIPGSTAHIPLDVKTIAEVMKEQGYETHMVGKWHLGYASWKYTPIGRGFDTFTGYLGGMIDYYNRTMNAGDIVGYDFWHNTAADYTHDGSYTLTDYMTDSEAALRKTVAAGKPSFLYFAHQNIHIPIDVPPTTSPKCESVSPDRRKTLCDMMSVLDSAIGETLQLYKDLGIWNNTLMIITTDNGGMTYYQDAFPGSASSNWPLRAGKTTLFEGGVKGVCLLTGGDNVFPSNIRNLKYFGMAHAADLMPTILTAAGMSDIVPSLEFDGVSHWESITKNLTSPRSEVPVNIVYSGLNYTSIINNDMKLIVGKVQGAYDGYWTVSPYKEIPAPFDPHNTTRLFNLSADPNEYHNIAESHPEIVEFLKQRIESYVKGKRYSEPTENTFHPLAVPELHNGTWAPFLH